MPENTVSLEEEKKKIINEFKSVMDFYRMEYSENLLALFNNFGCLLTGMLYMKGYLGKDQGKIRLSRGQMYFFQETNLEEKSGKELEALARELENAVHYMGERWEEAEIFRSFQGTIRRQSVLRPLLALIQELICLWEKSPDLYEMYRVAREICDLCVNTKSQQSRYVLPDEIVETLAGQLLPKEGEPVKIFDPQYASGSMLLSAARCAREAKLYGCEENEELRLSARILCILAEQKIQEPGEDFLEGGIENAFDLVLANLPFTSESIRPWDWERNLPSVKQKYNLFFMKSLLTLGADGYAAMVVPDSFLFSTKRETVLVREWVLNQYGLEMVLSLPSKTFRPYSAVKSSVLVVQNPVMSTGWREEKTRYVCFYEWDEDLKTAGKRLAQIRQSRDALWEQWHRSGRMLQNYNGISYPEEWKDTDLWFAHMEEIKQSQYSLLPQYYKPARRREIELRHPEELLEELLKKQETVLQDMEELLEEVRSL